MNVGGHYRSLFLLAAAFPTAALAAQPGWYLAIDGGQAQYNGIASRAQQWISLPPLPPPDQGLVVVGSNSSLQRNDSNDAAYRLTVGYQVNRYFGIGAGYVSLGEVQATGNGTVFLEPADGMLPLEELATFSDAARLRAHGWEIAATGTWPVTERWSLLGRLGLFASHTNLRINATPAPPAPNGLIALSTSDSNSSWSPTYGIGVSFSPISHWAARMDWDRYTHLGDRGIVTGRFNVNLLSLGVVYSF